MLERVERREQGGIKIQDHRRIEMRLKYTERGERCKPVEGCEKKKRSEGQRNLWLPSGRVVFSRARVFSAYQLRDPPLLSNLNHARQKLLIYTR